MITVNYFIVSELFNLLERIQVIMNVDFCAFDTDNENDVSTIVELYIKPTVMKARFESQEAIRHAIAYYTTFGTAPFQLMKDRCQDLYLPDAESWSFFFDRVGATLFGSEYKSGLELASVVERPDERECETLFQPRVGHSRSPGDPLLESFRSSIALACQSMSVSCTEQGRSQVLALPRAWVLEHIENVATSGLDLSDFRQYRRLLELASLLDGRLLQRIVSLGLHHPDVDVRDAAEGFHRKLSR